MKRRKGIQTDYLIDADLYDFNLEVQRFSIQKYDLLIFFLGQLDGP